MQNSLDTFTSSISGCRSLLKCQYAIVLVTLALAGCAPMSQRINADGKGESIYFVENRSVDLAVRKDFDKAIALLKSGQYEDAILILQHVAANTRDNSAPYINLGVAYSKIDKPQLAEKNFLKALEINPDHPGAINETAIFYRSMGRFEEARTLYDRVIRRYPNFMPARKNYGILCDLYLNDIPCAIEQYEAYSKANPADENVKLWISTLRQKL